MLMKCKIEGVKAEVAFAQAMMETGFLRFGGDVKRTVYTLPDLEQQVEEIRETAFPPFELEFEHRFSI